MSDEQTVGIWFTDDAQRTFAVSALDALVSWLIRRRDAIAAALPSGWAPPEIHEAIQAASRTWHALINYRVGLPPGTASGAVAACQLRCQDLPVLRLALEVHIEATILAQESTARLSHLETPQRELAEKIQAGHSILQLAPLAGVVPAGPFRLSEYLNLETVTKLQGPEGKLRDRVYDAKFHILMDQSLFLDDLRYFRDQCAMRDRPVSVAYIDIDNFGAFNRDLPGKETQVDRDVLPFFMSALERYVYAKGFAYREGGDEYLVLLPNADQLEALYFFDSLREYLAAVRYPIDVRSPTVSVGVYTALASLRQTSLQIQTLANAAKAHAKADGRNRVAGYRSDHAPSNDTLLIVDDAFRARERRLWNKP